MERKWVDWDSPEEQQAAADLMLQRAIEKEQLPKDAVVVHGEDGLITAKTTESTYYLGHISEGLTLLEENLNQN